MRKINPYLFSELSVGADCNGLLTGALTNSSHPGSNKRRVKVLWNYPFFSSRNETISTFGQESRWLRVFQVERKRDDDFSCKLLYLQKYENSMRKLSFHGTGCVPRILNDCSDLVEIDLFIVFLTVVPFSNIHRFTIHRSRIGHLRWNQ